MYVTYSSLHVLVLVLFTDSSTAASGSRSKKNSLPIPIIKTETVDSDIATEAVPTGNASKTTATSKKHLTEAAKAAENGDAAVRAANEKQVGSYLLSASPRLGVPLSPSLQRINKLLSKNRLQIKKVYA